jgi:hypothetical protein
MMKHTKYGRIGRIKVFIKNVRHQHVMKKFDDIGCFGISEIIIKELLNEEVPLVLHKYTKRDGRVENWFCPLILFKESEKRHLNEGHDPQRFVSMYDMVQW